MNHIKMIWNKLRVSQKKLDLKQNFSKERVKTAVVDMIFLIIACCIGSFATVGVMIPNGLTTGGLTGIVRIIQEFVPVDFSILYYGGSFIILIVVAIFLGFKEFRKILLLTIMYPAVLMVFEYLNFQLLEEKDIILAAIFCGAFNGLCVGTVFWRGYSFSGTDAIAKIIRKRLFPQFSLSKILLAIDACVIVAAAFIFGRNIALYALVTQVIVSKMTDVVIYGFETRIVQLQIITSQPEKVVEYIINDVGRGVSSAEIKGGYTKNMQQQLILLCSPRESILVRRKIATLDPGAFVTVLPVETVWGAGPGFADIDKES